MISAYKPDPRLPPDQQLLPTVAKRLQQEKWEQEGKFGNIYDKEFRPLNEEGFLKPPELEKPKEMEVGVVRDEWFTSPHRREKSRGSPSHGRNDQQTLAALAGRTMPWLSRLISVVEPAGVLWESCAT